MKLSLVFILGLCGCGRCEELPSNVRVIPVAGQFTFIETNQDSGVQMMASFHSATTGRWDTRSKAEEAARDYLKACALSAKLDRLKKETQEAIKQESQIRWQYQYYRDQIKKQEAQVEFAKEFNRTNTNPSMNATIDAVSLRWTPQKGDIELGYRPDGSVMWRELPEGKDQK